MIRILLVLLSLLCIAGNLKAENNLLQVVTSADYPPFESVIKGKIVGFDIDIIHEIAKRIGYDGAEIKHVSFHNLANMVTRGSADIAVSCISYSDKKAQVVSFSKIYFHSKMAILYRKSKPVDDVAKLERVIVGAQTGSVMLQYARKNDKFGKILTMDSNNVLVEQLKIARIDGVILEDVQAEAFARANNELSVMVLNDSESNSGYSMMMSLNSPLVSKVNMAIDQLIDDGTMDSLKDKWRIPRTSS